MDSNSILLMLLVIASNNQHLLCEKSINNDFNVIMCRIDILEVWAKDKARGPSVIKKPSVVNY